MSEVTKYTCGAMFSEDLTEIALIRKNRPDWMAGKLNFIGGHVEDGEAFIETMVREFREEAGIETSKEQWRHFTTLRSVRSLIAFFATTGDLSKLVTTTDEEVLVKKVADLSKEDFVPNVAWLVPMALTAVRLKEVQKMGELVEQQLVQSR